MKFQEKYRHVGYSYPGVPKGWQPIVERAVADIERVMWPQRWLPMFAKRWVHWLATGGSVVRVRSWFWHRVRERLTRGQMIRDIKDKYASLRIYGSLSDEAYAIVERAEGECARTCEDCGVQNEKGKYASVQVVMVRGWYRNICTSCLEKHGPPEEDGE